jgi:hypothetical protein
VAVQEVAQVAAAPRCQRAAQLPTACAVVQHHGAGKSQRQAGIVQPVHLLSRYRCCVAWAGVGQRWQRWQRRACAGNVGRHAAAAQTVQQPAAIRLSEFRAPQTADRKIA